MQVGPGDGVVINNISLSDAWLYLGKLEPAAEELLPLMVVSYIFWVQKIEPLFHHLLFEVCLAGLGP